MKDPRIAAAETALAAAYEAARFALDSDAAAKAIADARTALYAAEDAFGCQMRPIPRPLAEGDGVALMIGGGASGSCVVTEIVHTRVSKATEKAVELTDREGRAAWYPRRALVKVIVSGRGDVHADIARWFRPGWTHWNQWKNASVSGVSAA